MQIAPLHARRLFASTLLSCIFHQDRIESHQQMDTLSGLVVSLPVVYPHCKLLWQYQPLIVRASPGWPLAYLACSSELLLPDSDYSRIRKLPVNFVSEPAQCQSCSSGCVTNNTVNWGWKAAAVILPDYCTPHNLPFMSLWLEKAHSYKVKVQSENISASHFSSQPVMMTGWLVSWIIYAPRSTIERFATGELMCKTWRVHVW